MFLNLENRSTQSEIMDDFSMKGELLQRTLDQIAWINQWLGGNRVTINGLKTLLETVPGDQEITIIDLGCGSGDMLRAVAQIMRNEKRPARLIGIDANLFTVNYAKALSTAFPEISYLNAMIPSDELSQLNYDIVLGTLFFHHFEDDEMQDCLTQIISKARIGVVINDLHRSNLAIFLFKILTIFIPNPMVREDGVTSIKRGFKRLELRELATKLKVENHSIRWKWAFRFQWIINNTRKN